MNTIKALFESIFEGHTLRFFTHDGRLLFVAQDVVACLGIKSQRHALRDLGEEDKGGVCQIPSLGGRQGFATLTESGLFRLIFTSRKPVARRFSRHIAGEVMPQLVRYGSYIPGATPADRCRALRLRWKQERAELLLSEAEKLTATGLMTIAAFRFLHHIPARDAFAFARTVQYQASLSAVKPRRFFQKSGMRSAWPAAILTTALVNFQPRLALMWKHRAQ